MKIYSDLVQCCSCSQVKSSYECIGVYLPMLQRAVQCTRGILALKLPRQTAHNTHEAHSMKSSHIRGYTCDVLHWPSKMSTAHGRLRLYFILNSSSRFRGHGAGFVSMKQARNSYSCVYIYLLRTLRKINALRLQKRTYLVANKLICEEVENWRILTKMHYFAVNCS